MASTHAHDQDQTDGPPPAHDQDQERGPTLQERRDLLQLMAVDPSILTDLGNDLGLDATMLAFQAIACELTYLSVTVEQDLDTLQGTTRVLGGLLAGLWGAGLREDRDPDDLLTAVADRNYELGGRIREATRRSLHYLPEPDHA